jgi:tetratricopeptide (TPR) repeat protein
VNRLALFGCLIILAVVTLAGRLQAGNGDSYLNYLRGLTEERAGHITEALAQYEKVVQQDPQALEVYRDIAQLNLRLGQSDAALRAAEKIRDLAPNDPSSFLFLGNVQVAQGNLAKAAESYERALKLDPKNVRALENLGNYYGILDPLKALSYYQRYLELDPNDAEVHFQIGLVHQKTGNFKEAIRYYEKARELEPQQPAPVLALAELYELQKSTVQAIGAYTDAATLQPRNAIIYIRLGHLYYQNQQWDDAYSAFQNARSLQPQDAPIHYWLARVSEERKQWSEAAKFAARAYELSHDPQFMPLTAYYLTLERRLPEAVKWLERARRNDPNNPNTLLFLGMNYLELDKPKKAREALVHGVARHPDDAQLRFQLGIAEDRLGHFTDAVDQFQAVLKIDPKNAAAMNYLGYSFADRGIQLPEAEKLLRQAVAIEPENGAFLDSLGWLRYKQGDLHEAIKLLENAAKRAPDVLIFDHLGQAYAGIQDFEKATEAWTRALALDPGNAAIRKRRDDASSHLRSGTDQRRTLKRIEGNFRQVMNLRGGLLVNGRWKKKPVKVRGRLYFLRPGHLIVELNGLGAAPVARIDLEEGHVRIDPPEYSDLLPGLSAESLGLLTALFSGDLIASFDHPDVQMQTLSKQIQFSATDGARLLVNLEQGLLSEVYRPNQSGGTDVLSISEYALEDGLWLPKRIQWKNSSQAWNATLIFSNWLLNDPANEQVLHKAQ